jgi:hypothetical protein
VYVPQGGDEAEPFQLSIPDIDICLDVCQLPRVSGSGSVQNMSGGNVRGGDVTTAASSASGLQSLLSFEMHPFMA